LAATENAFRHDKEAVEAARKALAPGLAEADWAQMVNELPKNIEGEHKEAWARELLVSVLRQKHGLDVKSRNVDFRDGALRCRRCHKEITPATAGDHKNCRPPFRPGRSPRMSSEEVAYYKDLERQAMPFDAFAKAMGFSGNGKGKYTR